MTTPIRMDLPGCACPCDGEAVGVNYFVCVTVHTCSAYRYALNGVPGCAVVVAGGGHSYSCTTDFFGGCCVGPLPAGAYTATATTPCGASHSAAVTVVDTGVSHVTNVGIDLVAAIGANSTILSSCADAPAGVHYDFGPYGSCSSSANSSCGVCEAVYVPPNTTVTCTATYQGRTQSQTQTMVGFRCFFFEFYWVYSLSIGACGCGAPQPDTAITVLGPAAGFCTTDAAGACCVVLHPAGVPGDRLVVTGAKAPRFSGARVECVLGGGYVDGSLTGDLATCPHTRYDPYLGNLTENVDFSLGLQVAGDYVCACCTEPIKKTLHYSDTAGNSGEITYDPALGFWHGCGSTHSNFVWDHVHFCITFQSDDATVPLVFGMGSDCGVFVIMPCVDCDTPPYRSFIIMRDGVSCPDMLIPFGSPGYFGYENFPVFGTVSCPPMMFAAGGTHPDAYPVRCHPVPSDSCFCGTPYGGGFTATVTE